MLESWGSLAGCRWALVTLLVFGAVPSARGAIWPPASGQENAVFWRYDQQSESIRRQLDLQPFTPRTLNWRHDSDRSTWQAETFAEGEVFSSVFHGERGSGGGGDGLYCPSEDRLYALDFLLNHQPIAELIRQRQNCNEVIIDIYQQLREKQPVLAAGLQKFMVDWTAHFNPASEESGDPTHYLFLVMRDTILLEVKGEGVTEFAGLCAESDGKLYQAAVRLGIPGYVRISFDGALFEEMQKEPLQCSHLLLHEWVRDFLWDANDNRQFLHYLHSEKFFNDSEIELPGFSSEAKAALERDSVVEESSLTDGYSLYRDFTRRYGDSGDNALSVEQNIGLFAGKYISYNSSEGQGQKDSCRDEIIVHGIDRIQQRSVPTDGCPKNDAPFDCDYECNGYHCVSRCELQPLPECQSNSLEIHLKGLYELFQLRVFCDGEFYGSDWFVKEEAYDIYLDENGRAR